MNREKIYQVTQTNDVLVHLPLVADHLENFCSEKQQIGPSYAASIRAHNHHAHVGETERNTKKVISYLQKQLTISVVGEKCIPINIVEITLTRWRQPNMQKRSHNPQVQ